MHGPNKCTLPRFANALDKSLTKTSKTGIKNTRLNKGYMFSLLFKEGARLKSEGLSIQYVNPLSSSEIEKRDGRLASSKVGFLIRKKTGKAVFRNTLRRKLRTAFMQHAPHFSTPTWILFDIPKGPLKVGVKELVQNANILLGNLGKS